MVLYIRYNINMRKVLLIISGFVIIAVGLLEFFVFQNFVKSRGISAVDYQPRQELRGRLVLSTSTAEYKIKAPIVMYHRIRDNDPYDEEKTTFFNTPPAAFDKQLKKIKDAGFTTLFMKDLADFFDSGAKLPAKALFLTFDDGNGDFYTNAFPLLKKYRMKATLYAIVDYTDEDPGYLTSREIKEIAESGLVEIGSHTLNHVRLDKTGIDAARFEIFESKSKLEKLLGKTVWNFAYPYGSFNNDVKNAVKDAGYLTAVSVTPGNMQSAEKRYSLYRFPPTDAFFKKWVW